MDLDLVWADFRKYKAMWADQFLQLDAARCRC
jgi:hypothetical protein